MITTIGNYQLGSAVTLTVADSSVSLSAANIKPTTGALQGRPAEIAIVQAVGPLYIDFKTAATTAGFNMSSGDIIVIEGYENIRDMTFIRNTNSTTAVILLGYR